MRTAALLFGSQLCAALSCAQTTFIHHYGGGQSDIGFCVEQTSDGGYIMCGGSVVEGTASMDMYLVKADAEGNELWSRSFGTSLIEFAYSVVQTGDEGYVICGGWGGFGADTLALVKVDASGGDQWSRRYPINVDRSIGYSVIEADNGDLLCSGFAGPDAAFIRVNPDGEPIWTTLVDLGASDTGTAIRSTADGGTVALVSTRISFGVDGDLGLVRLNADGDTLWTRRFNTPEYEDGHGLAVAPNGDILITGRSGIVPAEVLLMRTDAGGAVLWSRTYGSPEGDDEGLDVEALDNGDILVTGRGQEGTDAPTGMLLMRCDADGDVLWQYVLYEGIFAISQSLCATDDGGFAMLGYTVLEADSTSDFILVKTDGSGVNSIAESADPDPFRIDMFPVPADVSTRLLIKSSWSGPFTFDLHDASGRRWMHRDGLTGTIDIPCADLPPGIFAVIVSNKLGPFARTKLQVLH